MTPAIEEMDSEESQNEVEVPGPHEGAEEHESGMEFEDSGIDKEPLATSTPKLRTRKVVKARVSVDSAHRKFTEPEKMILNAFEERDQNESISFYKIKEHCAKTFNLKGGKKKFDSLKIAAKKLMELGYLVSTNGKKFT